MRASKGLIEGYKGFPRKLRRRIHMLSVPKKHFDEIREDMMPRYTNLGIRESALRGHLRNSDIAWPWLRNLLALKRMYRNILSQKRLEQIDRLIEASNATRYSKLANCAINLRSIETKDLKKKKAWTESDWKKHMEYISQVAAPKKDFQPLELPRGKTMPLEALLPRLKEISSRPDFKCYKRMSQEEWYKNPMKVSPNALKYTLTKRMATLAAPKNIPTTD